MLVPWYVDVRRTIAKTLPLDTRHLANCWSWTTLQLSAHDPDLPFSFSRPRARRPPTDDNDQGADNGDQSHRMCEGSDSSHMRRPETIQRVPQIFAHAKITSPSHMRRFD